MINFSSPQSNHNILSQNEISSIHDAQFSANFKEFQDQYIVVALCIWTSSHYKWEFSLKFLSITDERQRKHVNKWTIS